MSRKIKYQSELVRIEQAKDKYKKHEIPIYRKKLIEVDDVNIKSLKKFK